MEVKSLRQGRACPCRSDGQRDDREVGRVERNDLVERTSSAAALWEMRSIAGLNLLPFAVAISVPYANGAVTVDELVFDVAVVLSRFSTP